MPQKQILITHLLRLALLSGTLCLVTSLPAQNPVGGVSGVGARQQSQEDLEDLTPGSFSIYDEGTDGRPGPNAVFTPDGGRTPSDTGRRLQQIRQRLRD